MSYTVGDDKLVCGYRQAYLHHATCIHSLVKLQAKVSHSIMHAIEMELIDCNREYCFVDALVIYCQT